MAACVECGNDDPVEGYHLCSDCLAPIQELVRAMPPPSEALLAELRRLLYPAQLSVPDEPAG